MRRPEGAVVRHPVDSGGADRNLTGMRKWLLAATAPTVILGASLAHAQSSAGRPVGDSLRFHHTVWTHLVAGQGAGALERRTETTSRFTIVVGAGDTLAVLPDSRSSTTEQNGNRTARPNQPGWNRKFQLRLSPAGIVTRFPEPWRSPDTDDLMGLALRVPPRALFPGLVWADTTVPPGAAHGTQVMRYQVVGDSVVADHPVIVVAITGTADLYYEDRTADPAAPAIRTIEESFVGRKFYSPRLGMVLKGETTRTSNLRAGRVGAVPNTNQTTETTAIALIR
jgi:hypothetical protein